jgi:glycosyltransferase involved in cell wall biosynthesis
MDLDRGDRVRIAQVSPFLPSRAGGSVVYSTNLALQLRRRGHDVEFYAARTGAEDGEALKERRVAVHTRLAFGVAFGVNPMAYVLPDLLKSDAEIIHAHSYIYTTSNQAAMAARVRRRPFVLHMHGATYQGRGIADRRISTALFLKQKVYDKTIGRWTIGCADAIAAVSAFDLQQCREAFDVSLDKLHLIPNAVDVEKFCPGDDGTERPLLVTFIGRLEEWKGPHSFLEIARRVRAEVPEATFKVAGSGPLQARLMADSRDLDGSFTLLGEVSHSRIADLLRETSVLVLPSFIEGLPTVCLEALASGIPVVASDTGGTSEIIREGETGYLCPSGDLDRFAERVIRLLRDPELRGRLGRQGRALVERQYSWTRVAEMTERLYERLV